MMIHAEHVHPSPEGDAVSTRRVAHELRTPLTSVLGVFDLLLDDSVLIDDDEAAELVAIGRREAEHMLFLVESLLTRSKLALGVLETENAPIDLEDLVLQAVERFPDLAARTLLTLERDAVVVADHRLVTQILTNLLQNVERYAPDGELEIRFERHGDFIALLVADDGPGVPPERREAVFGDEPTSERGLGVGLGISREIARALGGDLAVSDAPLRSGATFVLTLPRGEPQDLAPKPAEVEPRADSTLPASARLLVRLTDVFSERNLDRLVAGLHRMLADLLGAESACLVAANRAGRLRVIGLGVEDDAGVSNTAVVERVMRGAPSVFYDDLERIEPLWARRLGSASALFAPVPGSEEVIGVLAVGLAEGSKPSPRTAEIASAIARLAGLGIERATFAADADFERRLRSSVIESLPIAISVFAGDPPHIIDWNAAEERLLGIEPGDERPANLAVSQEKYNVRFLDGTPLDLSNSPVAIAIRTGASAGPFYLRVTRTDGTSTVTRTHCAPFFDEDGNVGGAVVTSEPIDESSIDG